MIRRVLIPLLLLVPLLWACSEPVDPLDALEGDVVGKVLDRAGEGVDGARVALVPADAPAPAAASLAPQALRSTTTRDGGYFSFDADAGRYVLFIQADGDFSATYEVEVDGARVAARVEIAESGSVAGVVLRAGAPVAGATVFVEGTTLTGLTNLDGEFLVQGVPPGERSVVVRGEGLADAGAIVVVEAGATADAGAFALAPAVDVVSTGGLDVATEPGATVTLQPGGVVRVADAAGAVAFSELEPGEYTVRAELAGHVAAEAAATVAADATATVTVMPIPFAAPRIDGISSDLLLIGGRLEVEGENLKPDGAVLSFDGVEVVPGAVAEWTDERIVLSLETVLALTPALGDGVDDVGRLAVEGPTGRAESEPFQSSVLDLGVETGAMGYYDPETGTSYAVVLPLLLPIGDVNPLSLYLGFGVDATIEIVAEEPILLPYAGPLAGEGEEPVMPEPAERIVLGEGVMGAAVVPPVDGAPVEVVARYGGVETVVRIGGESADLDYETMYESFDGTSYGYGWPDGPHLPGEARACFADADGEALIGADVTLRGWSLGIEGYGGSSAASLTIDSAERVEHALTTGEDGCAEFAIPSLLASGGVLLETYRAYLDGVQIEGGIAIEESILGGI